MIGRKELHELRTDLVVAVQEIQQATIEVERAQRRLNMAEGRHTAAIERFVRSAESESKEP